MKKSLITFLVLGGGITGAIVYLNKPKPSSPTPTPVVESAPGQPAPPAPPEKMAALKPEAPPAISENANQSAQIPRATAAVTEAKPDDSASPIRKKVDALLSANSVGQKHALFQQFINAGELDTVIADLQQRAGQNPNDPKIPTTLGEGQLRKAGVLSQNTGNVNEMGILGMQADQNFDAALKLDPANWEAQLSKATALSYWPVELNKGDEVIQRLSSLIDQQEKVPAQEQFAQTYVLLGAQYQKAGKPDYARQTWLLGAQKFPNDPALRKKISGQ